MAKLVYWDIINGDDGNDGLSIGAPVRTLTAAYAAASNGDRIIIAPGVYPTSVTTGGGTFLIGKALMFTPQQAGKVIFDFEQSVPGSRHLTLQQTVIMKGIHFRNMGVNHYACQRTSGSPALIDCVFYQRDGAAKTGRGVYSSAIVENCSFYNLEYGVYNASVHSCYFNDVTSPIIGGAHDYNAYSGNVEANGIDTDTGEDPGFVDASAEDFRLDLGTAAEREAYRIQGRFVGPIGATGASGPWWDARWAQSRWMNPDPSPGDGMHGVWINDPDYEDPGGVGDTGEVVEDTGDYEPIVDLSTGTGNPDAVSARLLSPVFDWEDTGVELTAFTLARFVDGPAGAMIDTDTFLPPKYEYRDSATAFDWDDYPTAGPAWTEAEFDDDISMTERYQQVRITFQIEHTDGAAP